MLIFANISIFYLKINLSKHLRIENEIESKEINKNIFLKK